MGPARPRKDNKMRHFSKNAKWLMLFAPFRGMVFSSAYLTPFFVEHGLKTSEIFLLQSIFSATFLLWEVPSGIIADKIGHALSIKISAPIAAISMIAYGLSNEYWQFVVCELILALANGLISGVDTALLVDSLKADKREKDFVRISQRIDAIGFVSVAVAVPASFAMVQWLGISSTLIADGALTLVGMCFTQRLVEAPRASEDQDELRRSSWHAFRELANNAKARWLIALKVALSTSTYIAFWLSALYYQGLSLPAVLFGALLAIRSAWKAWLSHRFHGDQHAKRKLTILVALTGLTYLGMATQQIWLIWIVLGHDAVQALGSSPLVRRLNDHLDEAHRAAMNGVANLVQRLAYTIVGPLAGLAVDKLGLQAGLVILGLTSITISAAALLRLNSLKALE